MNCSTPGLPVITNSQSLPKLISIESVMPSNHLILCHPLLLLPPSPPSIRVFSNESTLRMRWPKMHGREEAGCRRVLASLYWEGPSELPHRRSSSSAPRRDSTEPRPRGCSCRASLPKACPASSVRARHGAGCGSVGAVSGALLVPQLSSRLPFGPRSQASLQRA